MNHMCCEDRSKWMSVSWESGYVQMSRTGSVSWALLTKECCVIMCYLWRFIWVTISASSLKREGKAQTNFLSVLCYRFIPAFTICLVIFLKCIWFLYIIISICNLFDSKRQNGFLKFCTVVSIVWHYRIQECRPQKGLWGFYVQYSYFTDGETEIQHEYVVHSGEVRNE